MAKNKDYPMWVCGDCGKEASGKECGVASWHLGICGVCLKETGVTEPRDFGYPNFQLKIEGTKNPDEIEVEDLWNLVKPKDSLETFDEFLDRTMSPVQKIQEEICRELGRSLAKRIDSEVVAIIKNKDNEGTANG